MPSSVVNAHLWTMFHGRYWVRNVQNCSTNAGSVRFEVLYIKTKHFKSRSATMNCNQHLWGKLCLRGAPQFAGGFWICLICWFDLILMTCDLGQFVVCLVCFSRYRFEMVLDRQAQTLIAATGIISSTASGVGSWESCQSSKLFDDRCRLGELTLQLRFPTSDVQCTGGEVFLLNPLVPTMFVNWLHWEVPRDLSNTDDVVQLCGPSLTENLTRAICLFPSEK